MLFKTIIESVLEIDCDLKSLNSTGIFYAPELYISFLIGKSIYKDHKDIFGVNTIVWKRERKEYETGIADIVFETPNEKVVLELKIKSKLDLYLSDINKLMKLPDNYIKLFCVLIDSFDPYFDKRLKELEITKSVTRLNTFSFKTWSDMYTSKPVYCIIGLYIIN